MRDDAQGLRINVTAPAPIGIPPLVFDPVKAAIGRPLREVLEPLLVGPVRRQASATGAAIDVFPLSLPEGEGASLRLAQFGELGFANRRGLLVLTVPRLAAGWLQSRLGSAVERGPLERYGLDGATVVVELEVKLRRGLRAAIPLGPLGEIGVEGG